MGLTVSKIYMEEDNRESNLVKNSLGETIGYKQSKCTCKVLFTNGTFWTIHFGDLVQIINLLAENEDKKYNASDNPNILGRNLFLLYYLLPIFPYLRKYGFNPPESDLIKAQKFGGIRKQ